MGFDAGDAATVATLRLSARLSQVSQVSQGPPVRTWAQSDGRQQEGACKGHRRGHQHEPCTNRAGIVFSGAQPGSRCPVNPVAGAVMGRRGAIALEAVNQQQKQKLPMARLYKGVQLLKCKKGATLRSRTQGDRLALHFLKSDALALQFLKLLHFSF